MNLSNKTAVVLGVADRSSIAWAIADRFQQYGAKVYIGYQQKFFARVRLLLLEHPNVEGARCDVLNDEEMTAFFARFQNQPIDTLVHCLAYGPPDVFTSKPSEVRGDSFSQTLSISAHSLLRVAGFAKPYLREWASVMTLSYQASWQAQPFYGMMGVAKATLESCVRYLATELGQRRVRVNAISPGPIETPAALGEVLAFLRDPSALDTEAGKVFKTLIEQMRADPELAQADEVTRARAIWTKVQERFAKESALPEIVTQDDVADCALFLASDLSRKISGQTLHIDGGMSSSRMMPML
jgi:enoyl-[acyl-carrier protein] reductase I